MPLVTISSVKFSGVASAVPKKKVLLSEYPFMDDTAKARFSKRTGIKEARIGSPDLTASDMCFASAKKLLEDLKWNPDEIEALVFVSQSQDYPLPATACILQNRLGLPKTSLAFDISLGCSGYIYGLATISSLISAMKIKKALLLVGENTLMQHIPENTHSYPLFGDAGSATALEYNESAPDMYFELNTDGSGFESIIRRHGGVRHPITSDSFALRDIGDGAKARDIDCVIDGAAIMEFTINEVPPTVKRILNYSKMDVSAIDGFYFHQANKMINETIRKICKIPAEKTHYSIDKFANTSCASIPLTMTVCSSDNLASTKAVNFLCAFGVRLSWGGAIIRTDNIACPNLIEL